MKKSVIFAKKPFFGENTEKYKTIAVLDKNNNIFQTFFLIEKEVTRIDKNGEEIAKNISYILQIIDSARLWLAHYQLLSIIILMKFIKRSTDRKVKI